MHKSQGFTLVEILIAIAIIAILASISVAGYQQMVPRISLNSVTRDLTSDLRYAQQKAVTEQIIYDVKFNLATNSYQIIKEIPTTTIKTVYLNNRTTVNSITGLTNNTVRFNAAGAAVETGKIILINSNNSTSSVEIKPSGYVKINEK